MRVELLKLNEPTITGRIFNKESFNSIPEILPCINDVPLQKNKNVPFSLLDTFCIDLTQVIGTVTEIKIENDVVYGNIKFSIPELNDVAEEQKLDYIPYGLGKLKNSSEIIEGYTLLAIIAKSKR